MRRALKDICGDRGWFTGTFERYGSYKDKSEGVMRTALVLTDIYDDNGALVSPHNWLRNNVELRKYNFKPGDRVSFYGKVRQYTSNGRTDYGFSEIKKVVILGGKGGNVLMDENENIRNTEEKNELVYHHGDIVMVADPRIKDAHPYPCVVIREMIDRDGESLIVALRTNNPDFIKNYDKEITEELVICGRKRAFILSSLLYLSKDEVVEHSGSLTLPQLEKFDRMLLRNYGIEDQNDDAGYKKKYQTLKDSLQALIG